MRASTVLEIGKGSSVVSNYLINHNIDVTTLDVEKKVKPDILGSVESMPLEDNSFDIVLAAQVLEHIPYESFLTALTEINRVCRRGAIITLPSYARVFLLQLKIPIFSQLNFLWKPHFLINNKINPDSDHCWEIGKNKKYLSKVRKSMEAANFFILRDYPIFENPIHHFFILHK